MIEPSPFCEYSAVNQTLSLMGRYRHGLDYNGAVRVAIALSAAVGCSFSGAGGSGAGADASPTDGPDVDSNEEACLAFSPAKVDLDNLPPPVARLGLSEPGVYTLLTSNGTLRDPAGNSVPITTATTGGLRVLVARSLVIGGESTLAASGDRPLYIVATERVDLFGVLDAGSDGDRSGPGAVAATCPDAPTGGDTDLGGGGGGGGGGFGGAGGAGATGDSGGIAGGDAGQVVEVPAAVRAGCAGATGSDGLGTGGGGGLGGGAVEIAACELSISGTVTSGGQGGGGGGSTAGGGGGGSGGYIGLDALVLSIGSTTVLAANGGGGGEGGGVTSGGIGGSPGAASAQSADGGTGGSIGGGSGGAGSGGVTLDGGASAESATGGGGGGGGAAGYILIRAATTSGTVGVVSPPSRAMP
jgi:hypothetical protein